MTRVGKIYGPIDSCIYCGCTENLGKEHIVPKGLGGEHILLKASCKNCAKITSRFERYVLRELLINPRTTLGLPTYRKKQRPKSFTLTIAKNEENKEVEARADTCPTIIPELQYRKPRHIAQYPYDKGIVCTRAGAIVINLKRFQKECDFDSLYFTNRFKIDHARLLAKMAYGMAIACYGLENIEKAYVLPAILGAKDDIGYWVGCSDDSDAPNVLSKELSPYRIDVGRTMVGNTEEVRATIRLFPAFSRTNYLVIVGCLKKPCN